MHAQTTGNDPYNPSVKSIPTSPDMALLGRFGEIPVGHYTGTAQVSIPLYTAKTDNIEIPITLGYHTSGVKVADEATWVGLGWSLMPEGTISQEIRGQEDNLDTPMVYTDPTSYNTFKSNFTTLYAETHTYRNQKGFAGYNTVFPVYSGDDSNFIINNLLNGVGQPDIYTYNFSGYSGKFIINPENEDEIIILDDNEDIKFTKNNNGWIAVTPSGDKYYFYAVEKASSLTSAIVDVGYTFKLTKIELISGKYIDFIYQDETNYQQYPVQTAKIINFGTSLPVSSSINSTISYKKNLVKIETPTTIINFNLVNRDDIKPYVTNLPAKKLQSIDIISKFNNKPIKSFLFTQSYFPYKVSAMNQNINLNIGSDEAFYGKRLKLDNVKEQNYDNQGNAQQPTPPYKFDYNTSNVMPLKVSTSVDYYGYFNDEPNTTLLPDLDYFEYFNQYAYTNVNLNASYPYTGAKRFTNRNYIDTNILQKITYPTGGSTAFEYESNIFTNQSIPDKAQIQQIHKDIEINNDGWSTNPTQDYYKEFTLGRTTTIKFLNKVYDGYTGYVNPNMQTYTYQQMIGGKITFSKWKKNSAGQYAETIIKEWSVASVMGTTFTANHGASWEESVLVPFDSDSTVKYSIKVENSTPYTSNDTYHIASVRSRYIYEDPYAVDQNISYGNGVRVKSIKNYDSNNALVGYKKYNYIGGKLLYKFEPLTNINGATFKKMPTTVSNGCLLEYISVYNDLTVNSNDFGISGEKSFGYDKVEEIEVDPATNEGKGKKVFSFTNQMNTSMKGLPKIDDPFNGKNTSIEVYDENQNKISAKTTVYGYLPNIYNIYPSFSLVNTSMGSIDPSSQVYPSGCLTGQQIYTVSNPINTTKYRFFVTPLIVRRIRPTFVKDIQYFNNNTVEVKTQNFYENTLNKQLTKQTITYPDSNTMVTTYSYAHEKVNQKLIDANMIGIPLETTTTQTIGSSTKTLSKTETVYPTSVPTTQAGNLLLPLSVKSYDLQNSATTYTEVTYDQYDSRGNLQQYTTKDGVPVAIVWGYNQTQPIAKIEGATYAQINSLASAIIAASDTDASASINNDESALLAALDSFRNNTALSGYQVSTYTYDPLIGVRSITPPSGIREYYIYDSANRLEKVVDSNGNILKEYKYNYKQ